MPATKLNTGPMGMGTWAIGGPFFAGAGWYPPTGAPIGYGDVDDAESTRAIHCALECGLTFFDTADAYGTGHSERILGEALKGRRDDVVIATKFGNVINEARRELTGTDFLPDYIRRACKASLKRLQTERIDLYQLHIGDMPKAEAAGVADTLERLCDDGLIRQYGWSTDDPERAALFAGLSHATAVQFNMNVFQTTPAMLETCREHGFMPIIRLPLAMGFLSGKFKQGDRLAPNDVRSRPSDRAPYFAEGGVPDANWIGRLEAISEILTSKGRTPAQGALAWIWACEPDAVPIPGMRTVAQVRENTGALEFGPLSAEQMDEIDRILER